MDVLRHTGRAQLSSFIGGSPANRAKDRTQWELRAVHRGGPPAQVDDAACSTAPRGSERSPMSTDYVAGINAYIADARCRCRDDALRVRGARARPPDLEDHRRDRDGLADRRDLRQGRRQRARLGAGAAGVRQALGRKRRAAAPGTDFRPSNDPEAPTTVEASASPTRPTGAFASAGWRCPTPARSRSPRPRRRSRGRRSARASATSAQLLRAAPSPPRVQLAAGLRA